MVTCWRVWSRHKTRLKGNLKIKIKNRQPSANWRRKKMLVQGVNSQGVAPHVLKAKIKKKEKGVCRNDDNMFRWQPKNQIRLKRKVKTPTRSLPVIFKNIFLIQMYNSFSRVFSCGFPFRLAKENRFVQIGRSLKNQFYWPASHTLETLSGSGVVANSPWNVSIDRHPVKNITTITTNDRQRHKRQNETSCCRDFRYFQLDTDLISQNYTG